MTLSHKLKAEMTFIGISALICAGALSIPIAPSPAALSGNCFMHSEVVTDGTSSEEIATRYISTGTGLTQAQSNFIDDVAALLANLEQQCPDLPRFDGSLPGEPESQEPSETRTASELLDAWKSKLCTETQGNLRDRENGGRHIGFARTSDGTQMWQFTDSNGNTCTNMRIGSGTQLNGAWLNSQIGLGVEGMINVASTLIHEMHHALNPPSSPPGISSVCEVESGAYAAQIEWLCALAACDPSLEIDNQGTTVQELACHLIKYATSNWCKRCPEGTKPACGPCGTVEGPCNPISPSIFPDFTSPAFYPGIGREGRIRSIPSENRIEFEFMYGGQEIVEELDFEVELPGFQLTDLSLPMMFPTGVLAVAGYDVTSFEGWLLQIKLDMAGGNASWAITTEYKGTGFGAAISLLSSVEWPSYVVFLDKTDGDLMLCNHVTDTCTVLASAIDYPGLLECETLSTFNGIDAVSGSPMVWYVASERDRFTVDFHVATPPNTTELRFGDIGMNGTIDFISIR